MRMLEETWNWHGLVKDIYTLMLNASKTFGINHLTINVTLMWKPVNLFTTQINWLVSIWDTTQKINSYWKGLTFCAIRGTLIVKGLNKSLRYIRCFLSSKYKQNPLLITVEENILNKVRDSKLCSANMIFAWILSICFPW